MDSVYFWPLMTLAAVFIGVKIIKIIPENVFFKIVTWALLLISLKLVFDGLKIHF